MVSSASKDLQGVFRVEFHFLLRDHAQACLFRLDLGFVQGIRNHLERFHGTVISIVPFSSTTSFAPASMPSSKALSKFMALDGKEK